MTAETPADALRVVDERPIDCVLSDFKMPGLTGVQLPAEVAARRPDAARLLITGWNVEIPEDDLAEVGVFRVMAKPWEYADLKRTLREAMGIPEVSG